LMGSRLAGLGERHVPSRSSMVDYPSNDLA
jgi:hypothetical protein